MRPRLRLEINLVRRLAVMLLLLAVAFANGISARAQTPPQEPPSQSANEVTPDNAGEELARWTRVLERVENQLSENGLTPGALKQLWATTSELQEQLAALRPSLVNQMESVKKLVDALGQAPKEGEPPETSEIASQRIQLNDALSKSDGRLKQLDLLAERTREIQSSISGAESAALGNRLLAETPSLLSPDTWLKSYRQAHELKNRVGQGLLEWWHSPRAKEAAGAGYVLKTAALILLSAVLGWILRKWLIRRFGRKYAIENPTFRMRVRAVLAESAARTAIPIVVASAAYAALRMGGVLFDLSSKIAFGFVFAVMILSILYGVPRAILSPSIPHWRLTALGDATARLWYRYALILAAIAAFDMILVIPAQALRPPDEIKTTYSFFVGTAYACFVFLMAVDRRLWLTPFEEAKEHGRDAAAAMSIHGGPERRNRWWLLFRTFSAAMALSIPASALAGYGVLSDFITRRMLVTGAVILVSIILHGLARDIVAILTRDTDRPPPAKGEASPIYVWSVLVLDIGLVLAMVIVILPLWGGQWDQLLERLGWSMTGFKIGNHVFSLTDALAGVVVFIVVVAIIRSIQHFISRRVLEPMRLDSGVRDSLSTAIGYVGLVIAAVIGITTAGIDLSGVAIVAGALSVGVGFGLQSIVNNFVSGLILLAERPIKVGDWVQVGEHEGTVQRISVRSTEIKTFSRASVIVPNSELISSSVINWMHRDDTGRIEIAIGVGYESDAQHVRELLLQCAKDNPAVSKTSEPQVVFMDFGDNALMFELRCIVSDVSKSLRTSSDLRFAINETFRREGISIPFPQRDLHIKDATGLAQIVSAQGRKRNEKAAPSASRARKRPTGKGRSK